MALYRVRPKSLRSHSTYRKPEKTLASVSEQRRPDNSRFPRTKKVMKNVDDKGIAARFSARFY